jgi:plasmid maintenance system antidote protein VapI
MSKRFDHNRHGTAYASTIVSSPSVTLAEVARHAGVSQSTVSYVLSGKRSISAATRRRVEQSIARSPAAART